MRRVQAVCFLVVTIGVGFAKGREESAVPPWAEGIPVFTQAATTVAADDDCDLCRRPWQDGLLVTQDRRDTLYVLDPTTGGCIVYSPAGEELDAFTPEGWQPLQRAPQLTGFAVSPRGDRFAAASGNLVTVFTQEKVELHTTVPTLVSSVAMTGRDVLLGELPMRVGSREGGISRSPHLLAWLDDDGEIGFEALAPEAARGPDPTGIALTQAIEIASDPRDDLMWALDQNRVYRVRRLSHSGEVEVSWTSDRTRQPVRFEADVPHDDQPDESDDARPDGEAPVDVETRPAAAEVEKSAGFVPIDAPRVVWDGVARDGWLWVLAKVGGGHTVVDVFDRDCEGPIVRMLLPTDGRVLTTLAVTDDSIWVFPVGFGEGHPIRYARDPDWQMREMVYGETPQTASSTMQ